MKLLSVLFVSVMINSVFAADCKTNLQNKINATSEVKEFTEIENNEIEWAIEMQSPDQGERARKRLDKKKELINALTKLVCY